MQGIVLLVDDAHSVGVVCPGRGSWRRAGGAAPELLVLPSARPSAFSGAAVLCDEAMADYLLSARHLIHHSTNAARQEQWR